MPVSDLMMTGLQLMLLGMGIVFSFLILLVVALKGMSWLARRLPATEAPATPPVRSREAPADTALIAVIGAAVSRYRASRSAR